MWAFQFITTSAGEGMTYYSWLWISHNEFDEQTICDRKENILSQELNVLHSLLQNMVAA